MRLFDIGMPVLTFVGTGIFFPLFQNLHSAFFYALLTVTVQTM